MIVSSAAILLATLSSVLGQGVTLDTLSAQPGAQATSGKESDGSEYTEVRLRSGVAFRQTRRPNGDVDMLGMDLSGHGAVMCTWGIYVALARTLEVCPDNRNEPLRADLADAVAKINDFIVANSLSPVTKADLDKHASSMLGDASQLCRSNDVIGMLKVLEQSPRDKLRSGIDDLLSVPRPPVMDPCF